MSRLKHHNNTYRQKKNKPLSPKKNFILSIIPVSVPIPGYIISKPAS